MTYLVPVNKRKDYLPFLLLADENEAIIMEYINEGEMYAVKDQKNVIGVCLFTFPDTDVAEIKNIALTKAQQGKGIGKAVIQEAFHLFKKRGYSRIFVGTANSSLANLSFYQKAGFRFDTVRKDFFLNYPHPIYENGIQALDMVVFSKDLIEGDGKDEKETV
ncbi:N-acetyltransferase [Halobacillus sp. Marseille-Q1614]|uniref:GNAT family N-acetyltransferase n=1 Tax=Halobacillus sp. Marseille-Q1614 TaxID=2709134 RepID=UPI00156F83A6|nr:GNAT family N-acetyltransferase [Halobacillus sp. Marseille-Q1614]